MILGIALSLLLAWPAFAAEPSILVPAVIVRVEGDGIANVRKRSGIVEDAGSRGKVYPGDKVITDGRSAVHLLLSDGSLVKVGFNSELALEAVVNRRRYLSWSFRLGHGSIRALAETVPAGEVHLQFSTANGTAEVRGAELVLAHDETAGASSLYVLDGAVAFGATGCGTSKSCTELHGGESSGMAKGAIAPAKAQKLDVKDLFALQGGAAGPQTDARLSLFRDAKKVGQYRVAIDDTLLNKLVVDSGAELATAQDRAIGRTKAEREAMRAAVRNGTFGGILAAADAYAEAKAIFHADSNGGAEDVVAQAAAAKFRLGQAVIAADTADVFAGRKKDGEWSGRAFRERKSVAYDESANAKAKRQALHDALDDFRDTLEYVEALDADQVNESAKATLADGDAPPPPPPRPRFKVNRCDDLCEARRVDHEIDVASEGTVNAFAGKEPESPTKAVASRKGRGGIPSHLRTKFFSRMVPGDACTTPRETCRLVPCATLTRGARALKCVAGDSVHMCEKKLVPVRCPDR